MVKSAGIAIIHKDKVLLGHPTGASMDRMWGIPKGKIEGTETKKEAASRETNEEVGINIDPSLLKDYKEIVYKNKKGKAYKRVFYFVHRIKSLNEIGLEDIEIDESMLQLREINKAKFMTKEEAKDIMFWRMKEILDLI